MTNSEGALTALREKKLYIFDMDGTIYLGGRPFPFAIDFIKNCARTAEGSCSSQTTPRMTP